MLRSLRNLIGFRVDAIDGTIGTLADLLVDDSDWAVRYLALDTEPWIAGQQVLISPATVSRSDWESGLLRVRLTRDQVREAPGVEVDPPVSRQQHERLFAYHAWPAYWGIPSPVSQASKKPREEVASEVERKYEELRDPDPHLRSICALAGYSVSARGGPIGQMRDLLSDPADWVARYLVVDTDGRAKKRPILVSSEWLGDVDWVRAKVHVDLPKEDVERAPPVDPTEPITRNQEKRLHEHFRKPVYWRSDRRSA